MIIKEGTIITPLPDDSIIAKKEKEWHVKLPDDYKNFIKECNGGIPQKQSFTFDNHSYAISRFLGIVKDIKENELGWYDIGVVESQIGERLTDNMDLVGMDVVPIAELFAGDYLCLDFKKDKESPEICLWYHEESEDFSPMIKKITEDFETFLEMLE